MIVKMILFTMVFLIIAYILGSAVRILIGNVADVKDALTRRLALGFNTFFVISIPVCLISGYISCSIHSAITIILLLILIIFVLALLISKKQKISLFFSDRPERKNVSKKEVSVAVINGLLICFQIFVVIRYAYNQVEAVRLIPVATKVYDAGICVKGSPVMNLWGIFSGLAGIHPLNFIYAVLPASMLILFYSGYYSLLLMLCKENRLSAGLALTFVSMLNIWGYQSERLVPMTLLFSWFTGQCIVVHALLPLSLSLLAGGKLAHKLAFRKNATEVYKTDNKESYDVSEDELYEEEWDMKKHKIINARNLAIAIGLVAVALVGFVFILNSKINTLHAATANLQRDLDSRCAMYEFTSESGEVKGYLLEGSDGSRTMVGGGNAQDAEALSEFLGKHGTELTNWYLYGVDDDNKGAYDKCVKELGISVKNIYVLYTMQVEK